MDELREAHVGVGVHGGEHSRWGVLNKKVYFRWQDGVGTSGQAPPAGERGGRVPLCFLHRIASRRIISHHPAFVPTSGPHPAPSDTGLTLAQHRPSTDRRTRSLRSVLVLFS